MLSTVEFLFAGGALGLRSDSYPDPAGIVARIRHVDRMPGKASQPWCPYCHGPPGPDCPDRGKSGRQVRRALKRELEGLTVGDDEDNFFVGDEPVADVLAAFEAGEKVQTEAPHGVGWCASSP